MNTSEGEILKNNESVTKNEEGKAVFRILNSYNSTDFIRRNKKSTEVDRNTSAHRSTTYTNKTRLTQTIALGYQRTTLTPKEIYSLVRQYYFLTVLLE